MTMAATDYPRYMTFAPGELEQEMRRIGKLPDHAPVLLPSRSTTPSDAAGYASGGNGSDGNGGGRSKLLKELAVAVTYPDGSGGPCRYERLGPSYHRFDYRYEDGALMHRQHVTKPMENTPEAIEEAARDGATLAFQEAIAWEKRDRFCRVSEPTDGSRKKEPHRYQMSAKAAKAQAGKYAVCQRLGSGEKLLPASGLFDTIEEANDAWRRLGESKYVVACGNRLDRCWDIPKYNPMPRSEREQSERSMTSSRSASERKEAVHVAVAC